MKRILHVDMNSFFVSCELSKYDQNLVKDIKLVIAGDKNSRRGIITASSYSAKKDGVKSAMTLSEALRKSPDLVVKEIDFTLYRKMSKKLFSLLHDKFELVEQASIDEAYIDITSLIELNGNDHNIAKKLQQNIMNNLNLPCSIGIGDNRLQSKMASNKNKPNKITIIKNNFLEIFGNDDISTIHGIGLSSQKKYRKFGINTVNEIANYNEKKWIKRNWNIEHLYKANGYDIDIVNPLSRDIPKSISNERTLKKDISLEKEIIKNVDNLFNKVFNRLVDGDYMCKTISVKFKFDDFTTKQVSRTNKKYTNNQEILKQTIYDLITHITDFDKKIRLISIGFSSIITNLEYKETYLRYFEPFKEYLIEK